MLVLLVVAAVAGCASRESGAWTGATLAPTTSSVGATVPARPFVVTMEDGVRSWVDGGRVEILGRVALEQGWLEVAVCRRGSREHESVVVVDAEPSVIHAALLLAGFDPGSPAVWNRGSGWTSATGDRIQVSIRVLERGRPRTFPLTDAIQDERGDRSPVWVFAGSRFSDAPVGAPSHGRYLADLGGTVVGLSTFGDEVVAGLEVRSPETAIDPVTWKIRRGVLPPVGAEVTVVLSMPVSDASGGLDYSATSSGS